MDFENQVCTLEQADKLKELTVSQISFAVWCSDRGDNYDLHTNWKNKSRFKNAAFTVAELGVMLPDDGEGCGDWYTNKDAGCYEGDDVDGFSCWHFMDNKRPITIEGSKVFPTEAQARAALLIHLLETGKTTAEEVNNRLLSA